MSATAVEYADCTSAKSKTSPMRLPVDRGWQPVMLKYRILMVEQYLAWQLSGQVTLTLTGLDEQSDRPDPINRSVGSSSSTYIFYPDSTFKSAFAENS